jgi:hypothetical protein
MSEALEQRYENTRFHNPIHNCKNLIFSVPHE